VHTAFPHRVIRCDGGVIAIRGLALIADRDQIPEPAVATVITDGPIRRRGSASAVVGVGVGSMSATVSMRKRLP
jgi:hypothetical protein